MKKKVYDKAFKINAVHLVIEQRLSVKRVSQDLGIGFSTLQRWVYEFKRNGQAHAFPGSGRLNAEDDRYRKLERENEVLKRERDILKKALAIFSSP